MTSVGTQNGAAHNTKVMVVIGAQWGDEGKGKIVDLLASGQDVVCRCAGGNNAGHTVVAEGKTYDFHMLPSGIIHKNSVALIGNGVVLNIPALFEEIEKNGIHKEEGWNKRLIVSELAHLVFQCHMQVDGMQEDSRNAKQKIGTTKKGIGPCYSNKYRRLGVRVCDLMGDFEAFKEKYTSLVAHHRHQWPQIEINEEKELEEYKAFAEKLRTLDLVRDTASYLANALNNNKKVLVEGANGALLDIDFGTYPFVTSSNCTVGGAVTGLGVPASRIGEVVGIVKAYQTRVGAGPFPTEQPDNGVGGQLRAVGHEFGVTTGRPRRCGWLDLVMLKRSTLLNGFTAFALTKLDVLDDFDEIKIGVTYKLDGKVLENPPALITEMDRVEVDYVTLPGWKCVTATKRSFDQLPVQARDFIKLIETETGVKVRWIGVGQDRDALIDRS